MVLLSISAPNAGARVLPIAISNAVEKAGSPVVKLTKNAPRKMPNQHEGPHIKAAASAMPVGGQNKVMLEPMKGMLSPSFPAIK